MPGDGPDLRGGRKRVEGADPHVRRVLARLVEASTAGDPMSYLLWTNKSTHALADELARQGYAVSHVTVARCLRELGYSLHANVKTIEGTQHPDWCGAINNHFDVDVLEIHGARARLSQMSTSVPCRL